MSTELADLEQIVRRIGESLSAPLYDGDGRALLAVADRLAAYRSAQDVAVRLVERNELADEMAYQLQQHFGISPKPVDPWLLNGREVADAMVDALLGFEAEEKASDRECRDGAA